MIYIYFFIYLICIHYALFPSKCVCVCVNFKRDSQGSLGGNDSQPDEEGVWFSSGVSFQFPLEYSGFNKKNVRHMSQG